MNRLLRSLDLSVPSHEASALTIAGVLHLLWHRRWLFVAVSLLSMAGVVAWAYLATPTYRVTAKLMPRQEEDSAAAVQSLLGQFGGLASLAGISLGTSVNEQESIAWLKSRALAERFLERKNLLPILFSDAWDETTQRWRADLEEVPSMDDAWAFFDRRVRRVTQDTKSKLITVEMIWKDRRQATEWANEFVQQANEELRQRSLREADASLESLEEQLTRTDTVERRQSIYRLMEAQVNRKVLAKSRPEYAFALLDPPRLPMPTDSLHRGAVCFSLSPYPLGFS